MLIARLIGIGALFYVCAPYCPICELSLCSLIEGTAAKYNSGGRLRWSIEART